MKTALLMIAAATILAAAPAAAQVPPPAPGNTLTLADTELEKLWAALSARNPDYAVMLQIDMQLNQARMKRQADAELANRAAMEKAIQKAKDDAAAAEKK